ncbi:alanine dehydrogenase [candidate division KSB1 bacterium]|nr:alanine dehydrogenase [candidate division KSB1 bacterium]
MLVGVLKEIKKNENRVSLLPSGVELLKYNGHSVLAEKDCGVQSGFSNEQYAKAGAEIVDTAAELYKRAEMVMKVKEPMPVEYNLIRENQIVFTYFHFAASRELTDAIIKSKSIAIAYETITKADGSLPLLTPMSEVAGRMAIQQGATHLQKETGGLGKLLGGVPGVEPGLVVILGGGVVGTNAAKMAAGLGARVVIMDTNLDRLRYLDDVMPKNVITMMSNPANIRTMIAQADLLVGAVLIPGAKAPKLVTREMLKLMKPGAVMVDVSIDQGGCIETMKPTTHADPTYEIDGIVHYGVANMPGAVPRTSTIALTNATLPYAIEIANRGYKAAIMSNPEIKPGANIVKGLVTFKGVAEAFDLPYTPIEKVLG